MNIGQFLIPQYLLVTPSTFSTTKINLVNTNDQSLSTKNQSESLKSEKPEEPDSFESRVEFGFSGSFKGNLAIPIPGLDYSGGVAEAKLAHTPFIIRKKSTRDRKPEFVFKNIKPFAYYSTSLKSTYGIALAGLGIHLSRTKEKTFWAYRIEVEVQNRKLIPVGKKEKVLKLIKYSSIGLEVGFGVGGVLKLTDVDIYEDPDSGKTEIVGALEGGTLMGTNPLVFFNLFAEASLSGTLKIPTVKIILPPKKKHLA